MQAAYLIAPQQIELREEPMPAPDAGGLVVRVRAALTDGTDLKAYRRGHPQMPMPTRFGHEFSGDVAALGADVQTFAVGQRIASVHSAPCGACFWCKRGQAELCESVMRTKILGAYAEYVALPEHIVRQNAFAMPDDLSYEAAAFLEPLACVVHSLDVLALGGSLASAPDAQATIAVIGDGGFGLLHAAAIRGLGLGEPILIGRRAERLELARTLGVQHRINAREEDALARVLALTGGRGADAVVECTGTQAVWEAAPDYVRRGGTVSLFGGLPTGTRVSYDAARLHYDEIRLVSPFHFTPRAVRRAFELLAQAKIDVLPLVSGRYTLDRVGELFATLDAGHGIKYAVIP